MEKESHGSSKLVGRSRVRATAVRSQKRERNILGREADPDGMDASDAFYAKSRKGRNYVEQRTTRRGTCQKNVRGRQKKGKN